MPEIDDLETLIVRLRQADSSEEFLKAEAQLEEIEKMVEKEAPTVNQVLALSLTKLMRATLRHVRVDDAEYLFILELFLEQAKEIKTLNNIVVSLASERTELKHEVEKLKKKQRRGDRLLAELDKIVEERRKFYESNR